MMVNIEWCLEQKKGIELIEPNDNLSEAYFKETKETLHGLENITGKWSVIMGYYACYNALYALLMKAGVKCEIHSCTIKLMKLIDGFSDEDYIFIVSLKERRVRAQYYLEKDSLENLTDIKKFVLKCEEICDGFDLEKLRGKLNE